MDEPSKNLSLDFDLLNYSTFTFILFKINNLIVILASVCSGAKCLLTLEIQSDFNEAKLGFYLDIEYHRQAVAVCLFASVVNRMRSQNPVVF